MYICIFIWSNYYSRLRFPDLFNFYRRQYYKYSFSLSYFLLKKFYFGEEKKGLGNKCFQTLFYSLSHDLIFNLSTFEK